MKRILIFIILTLLLGSCSPINKMDVSVKHLDAFKLYSTSKADLSFTVNINNPTKSTITLDKFEGLISKDDRSFSEFVLMEPISLDPYFIGEKNVTLRIDLLDPLALLSIGLNINTWDMSSFTVDGDVILFTESGYKKTFRIRKMTLKKILKILN